MLRSLLLTGFARMPFIAIALETLLLSSSKLQAQEWLPANASHGQLAIIEGLPVAVVSGSPEEIGAAEGHLFRDRVKTLLELMRIHPRLLLARPTARFQATVGSIRVDDRARLTALGSIADVSPATLIDANALVDAQCSAVVRLPHDDEPLRVARNMDFFPAKALGPSTVLEIVRRTGYRAYAAITWPGSASVISGMNDAGVVACILLNAEGPDLPGAEPVGLRLARIMQNAPDLATAIATFSEAPVGSSHYVLLADAHTSAVVWHDVDGVHRDDPSGDWLTATNGVRTAHQPADVRGLCLQQACQDALTAAAPKVDAAWMRQVLTASYMPGINAQAMVFTPATLSVELAVGTGIHPAAKSTWWRINLAEVFRDGDVSRVHVETLPASVPLAHYTAGEKVQ